MWIYRSWSNDAVVVFSVSDVVVVSSVSDVGDVSKMEESSFTLLTTSLGRLLLFMK